MATSKSNVRTVSIVIVNYNSGSDLANCVSSITESKYPLEELIVVDNASGDNSLRIMATDFPNIKIIHNRTNLGYAGAANIGFKSTTGEFIAILNPDTLVPRDWLGHLVDAAARYPRGALFQPKILLMANPRLLNSAGNMIHVAGFGICQGLGTLDLGRFQEKIVSYTSGACTLIRRHAMREIGPMEELFFAYGEDKDWGWRASMMGWQSIYIPSSKILHKWSPTLGSTSQKMYFLEFERLLSIMKNYSNRSLILLLPVLVVVESMVLLHALTNRWLGEKLRSYADLFRIRKLILQRREALQKCRIVPDRVLIENFTTTIDHPYLGPAAKVLNRLIACMTKLVARCY